MLALFMLYDMFSSPICLITCLASFVLAMLALCHLVWLFFFLFASLHLCLLVHACVFVCLSMSSILVPTYDFVRVHTRLCT